MKTYLLLVVGALVALFTSVFTPAKAVDIITLAQLQQKYPDWYVIDMTFFVNRMSEDQYYVSTDHILNIVPTDDGTISLAILQNRINIWEIQVDRKLPSEPGFSYIATVLGEGEMAWDNIPLHKGEIAVDSGKFVGWVKYNLEIGSIATIEVIRFNAAVPEPAHFAIAGLGLVGFGAYRARRKR